MRRILRDRLAAAAAVVAIATGFGMATTGIAAAAGTDVTVTVDGSSDIQLPSTCKPVFPVTLTISATTSVGALATQVGTKLGCTGVVSLSLDGTVPLTDLLKPVDDLTDTNTLGMTVLSIV